MSSLTYNRPGGATKRVGRAPCAGAPRTSRADCRDPFAVTDAPLDAVAEDWEIVGVVVGAMIGPPR